MTENPSRLHLFLNEIQNDKILDKPFTMKNVTVFPFALKWWDYLKKMRILRAKLGLEEFIRIAPFETATIPNNTYTELQLVVKIEDYSKTKVNPLNSETLKECFKELGSSILTPIETETAFIIPVKRQVFENYYGYTALLRQAPVLLKAHGLPFYNFKIHVNEPIGFEIRKATPAEIIEEFREYFKVTRVNADKPAYLHNENLANPEISTVKKPNQQPETEEEQHIKTLERAFHKENPEAITKAVIFLSEKSGWTNKDFKSKYDVSDSTLSRIRNREHKAVEAVAAAA